jgi:hypothetical protein
MEHSSELDIVSMMGVVNRYMAYEVTESKDHKLKQMSCLVSTLTRTFFLRKKN